MKTKIAAIAIIIISTNAFAQFNKTFGVSVNAVYNTSASIYLSPNSSDVILRNNSFLIENIFDPCQQILQRVYSYNQRCKLLLKHTRHCPLLDK